MEELRKELKKYASAERAKASKWFFKTGPGQYGEGDVFIGLTVPDIRKVAKEFGKKLSLNEVEKLLSSEIHEERLVSLLILVDRFKKGEEVEKKEIYEFYLKNAKRVNNWDLVDLSAPYIVGGYLLDKDRKVLYKLAKSNNLWEKRIAIISTFAFIRNNEFGDTLAISEILLGDSHDLIHKAVGWMLREVGKKDVGVLKGFLKKNYSKLPRTTLRYAIERFPEDERKSWLKGPI